ncbi:MAG: hypothetical protein J1E40_05405 [Oscillospiraceae bacterium]|nr:hypothetical protein [Oscillospiraceae bacterium]
MLDIAQSTGKLRTAAYYYCVEMTLCILKSDKDGAAHVYDEGVYYLEAFPDDDRILTVLAIYQTAAGLYEAALKTLEKITWHSLPKKLRKYGLAVCSAIASVNLVNLGRNDEAIEKAKTAIMCKCSQYVTVFSRNVIDRAEEAAQKEPEKDPDPEMVSETISEAEPETAAENSPETDPEKEDQYE